MKEGRPALSIYTSFDGMMLFTSDLGCLNHVAQGSNCFFMSTGFQAAIGINPEQLGIQHTQGAQSWLSFLPRSGYEDYGYRTHPALCRVCTYLIQSCE